MGDKVFYESLFCIVTNKRIFANGKIYLIHEVSDVMCATKSHLRFAPCVVLVFLMLLIDNSELYVLLFSLIISGWFLLSNDRYMVKIKTNEEVIELFSSNDKEKVKRISRALDLALSNSK